jgi:transposase InsO family protein
MGVSRSGYYRYLKAYDPSKIPTDFELISKVKEIHHQSNSKYGTRRISEHLKENGHDVGRYRARTLMKKAGVSVQYKKKFRRTTDSNHNLPVARNILNRQFDVKQPNTVWCSDITYLWTNEGWLYLAVVIDLYSRKIVGWSLNSHMKASLVSDALQMAYFRRHPNKGLVHHSDRGSQYASKEYQKLLTQNGMICSMSRKGNCWDNAVVESFFHTLKTERTDEKHYRTRDEARYDVIDYIEMFYNCIRLHSSNGYKNPNSFESVFNNSFVA